MKRIVAGLMFAAFAAAPAWAQKEVTIGYQDMVVPYRIAQEAKEIEKATGYKVNWKQFGGGGEVIKAMASGAVQIGEVGSAGIAAAVSRGEPLELFWILDDIGSAEALVAKNGSGINSVADLKGKKIAMPFNSTTHFHTMVALDQYKINPADVQISTCARPKCARRGSAATSGDFIWDPVLAEVKKGRKGDHHLRPDLGGNRQGHVRRLRGQQGLGEGQSRLHGEVREDHGCGRRQLSQEHRELDEGFERGEGRRQVVRREAGGRSGRHGAVQVPDRVGSGDEMAGRRREQHRREGSVGHRAVPALAKADREDAARLFGGSESELRGGSREVNLLRRAATRLLGALERRPADVRRAFFVPQDEALA
jgi:hypothetical protein